MTLQIEQFRRKTFDVDAIQVTPDNIQEVAEWCGGDVRTEKQKGRDVKFVKVRVYKALDDEQTKAFPGNFVVYMGSGYKVYKYNAFMRTFERLPIVMVVDTTPDQVVHRSSVDGTYVTAEFAAENPDTTYATTQD